MVIINYTIRKHISIPIPNINNIHLKLLISMAVARLRINVITQPL